MQSFLHPWSERLSSTPWVTLDIGWQARFGLQSETLAYNCKPAADSAVFSDQHKVPLMLPGWEFLRKGAFLLPAPHPQPCSLEHTLSLCSASIPCRYLHQAPAAPHSIQLPPDAPGKAAEDGSRAWGLCIYVGGLDAAPSCWLQPDPTQPLWPLVEWNTR